LALGLDVFERLALTALYLSLVNRLVTNYAHSHNIADLLVLASETLVVVLVFIRRTPQEITFRLQDWALALGGSALPLLLAPAWVHALGPHWIGWSLQMFALGAQLVCKSFLFRNFGVAPALRGVAAHGPYAIVRHPMYGSYVFGMAGFFYAFPTWWNAGLLALWVVAQLYRIHAEERVLNQSPDYRAYAQRVRWRLIPGIY
jgi:protein-S-isoprenylcysteine O-methyltransferase Ste14